MFLFCKHIKLLSLLLAFFQPYSSKFGLQKKVFKKAVYYRFINIKTYFDFRHGLQVGLQVLICYLTMLFPPGGHFIDVSFVYLAHKVATPLILTYNYDCVLSFYNGRIFLVVISCKLYYGSLKITYFHKNRLIHLLFKMLIQNV